MSEFLEYAKNNLSKGLDYYDKIYLKPDGKLFSLKKAFESGAIFDPDILRAKPTEVIEILIGQLCHFQFPEFNGDKRLLEEMKAQLSYLLKHLETKVTNWDGLIGAAEYNKKLAARDAKAAAAKAKGETTDIGEQKSWKRERVRKSWKDDPGERARRIWEFWRALVNGTGLFPAWKHAIRLVVLVQPSSAAAERIFTQLKNIVDACGESMLPDMLEHHLFQRCNRE